MELNKGNKLIISGEIIDTDCDDKGQSTKYRLIGVVVHSGQASGGHYYSYILHRPESATPKWYKFDDGDVSECKMEDDEVMMDFFYLLNPLPDDKF